MNQARMPAKPVEIVHCLASALTVQGGAEEHVLGSCVALARQRSIGLIAGRARGAQHTAADLPGIRVCNPPILPRSARVSRLLARATGNRLSSFDWGALSLLASLPRIRLFLHGARILEVHYPTEALLFMRQQNLRTIMHVHGCSLPACVRRLHKRVFARTDLIIACSDWTAKQLARQCGDVPLVSVHNGVDAARFRPLPAPRTRAVCTIGMVGRLSTAKGLDVLLAAARVLGPSVCVCIAGPPAAPADAALLRRFDQPNVTYYGPVSRMEMPGFYQDLDCFVLPSRSENFPLTVLEAMGCGLPVIASRVGGIPEVLAPGTNGLLVEPGDIADLVQAIRRLADDRAFARRLGHAGREIVTQRFTLDQQVQRQLRVYAELEGSAS